tara:strand:+ start:6080 stop:6457 length:378 start_codon:yes stop_codon:yes gene_type:complete
MKPVHKFYNFKYRMIYPWIRNYECIPAVTLITQHETIKELGLDHEFLNAYIEYNNDPEKLKEFWEKWDNIRKRSIHTLIYNGAAHDLWIVKNSFVTIEYFKLLAWAYCPMPQHEIIKIGESHDKT